MVTAGRALSRQNYYIREYLSWIPTVTVVRDLGLDKTWNHRLISHRGMSPNNGLGKTQTGSRTASLVFANGWLRSTNSLNTDCGICSGSGNRGDKPSQLAGQFRKEPAQMCRRLRVDFWSNRGTAALWYSVTRAPGRQTGGTHVHRRYPRNFADPLSFSAGSKSRFYSIVTFN